MLGTLDFTGVENRGSFQFFLEHSLAHNFLSDWQHV